MIKIACIGDNVVDINYHDRMVYPGGNCVNVAVYCSQMGHQSAYAGVLGDDGYAKLVLDSLDANRVDHCACVVKQGETGRCSCKLVNGERILCDENDGGIVKSAPLIIGDDLIQYLKTFDLVHTSCYSYLDDQLFRIKGEGILLLYDCSNTWNREKVKEVGRYADYLLLSAREDLTQEENLKMLTEAVDQYGCSMSIMTMGLQGAWVYDGRRVFKKLPYSAAGGAVDTTGCGDSWISGFITAYMEALKWLDQMRCCLDGVFLTAAQQEDVRAYAIELGMCMGNCKASHTCRIKGAYGCGIKFK